MNSNSIINNTAMNTIVSTTSSRRVYEGNIYDSRVGNHSYTQYTTGCDYLITEPNGQTYAYRLRAFDLRVSVEKLVDVIVLDTPREISWESIDEEVRSAHFDVLFPNGTEFEKNLFVYGDVEGQRRNDEIKWAEDHLVYDRNVTFRLREEVGDFTKVRFLRTISHAPGTGYKSHIYVVDEKWQVTVTSGVYDQRTGEFYASYAVEDYATIVASQKSFGRRVSRMAKVAGVPWEIGVFVGHIADENEGIEILKSIKAARGTADKSLEWELGHCGIARRTAAIEELLGENWGKLKCRGQNQTTTLANYLLGE